MPNDNKIDPSRSVLLTSSVFIVWKPEHNLGVPIVDEQHRGIVSNINSLYFAMQNDCALDVLLPIIDVINDYTRIHFDIEEAFLAKCGYPDVEGHHKLHDELTLALAKVGRKSLLDHDPFQFMDFLKKWWIDHICEKDKVFRDYLVGADVRAL